MLKIYAHLGPINNLKENLGDKFGFLIGDFLLGGDNYTKYGMHDKERVDSQTVAIVGSSIAALTDTSATIAGAGLINSARRVYSENLNITGVRGHLTQALILRDSDRKTSVISDPGLLISRLYPLPFKSPAKKKPLGFIIHKVDRKEFREKFPQFIDCMVDNHEEPHIFSEQLSNYETIASTSLHGCIFCHAYGVPVAPFVLTDQLFGGDFKFTDYYSSLGIDMPSRANLASDIKSIERFISDTRNPTLEAVRTIQENQLKVVSKAISEVALKS